MPSPTNQCAPGTSNCGLGPLRYSVPLSSRGSSPVTLRNGASHSIGIGARLVRAALVVTWSSIGFLPQWNLYIVKICVIRIPASVKQNLYTVKIPTYKGAHDKKTKGKQGEAPAQSRRDKAGGGETGGAAYPRGRGFALSSWRLARCAAAGGGKSAGARRPSRADAARGGARGGRVACRAHPSFRRSHGATQRTRRHRLSPVQRGDGRGERLRHAAGEGDGQRKSLCRLCAGPSRHVRADVPHRKARHGAAFAA